MTIAVDFDGTIVEHAYPGIGKEIPFAIDALITLSQAGHHIILWSVREGHHLEEAVKYCHDRGLDFYAVNSAYPNDGWDGKGGLRKLKADVYIDDRNIGGIPEWGTIVEMVQSGQVSDNIEEYKPRHHHHHHTKNGFISWLKGISRRSKEARDKLKGSMF